MISCTAIGRMGRLGNQIFQFASCLGIATNLGFDFRIHFGTQLKNVFQIPERFFLPRNKLLLSGLYKEKNVGFDPGCMGIADGTDLKGYFQSPKYFSGIRGDLLKFLAFKKEVESKSRNEWDQTKGFRSGTEVVSLHVRRGDYVGNPAHPLCGMDYYDRACSIFKGCSFLVFSDDPRWCMDKFQGKNFLVVSSGDPLVDLSLMTRCDHHIIANSTFSWWGAWLSKSGGRVVAPSRWFRNIRGKFLSFDDIYCDGWMII